MGADLCLMIVPLETDFGETLENIRGLGQQELEWAKEVLTGDPNSLTDDEIVAELVYAAEIAFDWDRRDLFLWETSCDHDGGEPLVFVVTGGMTWGDDPTEAFTPLQLLLETGVTEK